jgi:hypothetical protein
MSIERQTSWIIVIQNRFKDKAAGLIGSFLLTFALRDNTQKESKMKRALLVIVSVLLLSSMCWAADAPKGQEVTITGRLTCTYCNLPAAAKPNKSCCQNCIKSGDPSLLEDTNGNLYILLSGEHEKPLMTPARMDLLGENVTVKGLLAKRGGVQGIYVKEMGKSN